MPTKEDLLLTAVRANNIEELQRLLSEGVDLTAGSRGFLAIKEAAGAGFTQIVNILLDASADIEARNSYGFTPLLSAVEHDHIDTVNLLLARGANVNAFSRKGDIALILAQTPEMLTTLLTAGALVDAITLNGSPALFFHAGKFPNTEQSQLQVVRLLLNAGANIEAGGTFQGYYGYGMTPLMAALQYGCIHIATELLGRGANVNAVTPDKNHSALLLSIYGAAAKSEKARNRFALEKVQLLLDAGADVNARDADGYSALMISAQHAECFDIVMTLLARGADKELVNRDDTAVSLANKSGCPEIASFIENFNTFQYRLNQIAFDESSLELADQEIFASLRDPITLEIMNDPVAVSSGITYDRISLQRWFESKKDSVTQEIPVTIECPITKLLIHRSELHNRTHVFIKSAINSFVSKLEAAFRNPSRSNEVMAPVSTVGIFAHTQQPSEGGAISSHSNLSSSGTINPGLGSKK